MPGDSELHIARVHLDVRFVGGGVVSHNWGPTLRGGFGSALRSVSCSFNRQSCSGCALARLCAYGYLFETPIGESDTVMRKYTHAPHPFVLEPPVIEPSEVTAGSAASFAIVLIEKAVEYVPSVVLAMQELGRRGLGRGLTPFEVERVVGQDHTVLLGKSDDVLRPTGTKALSLEPGESRAGQFTIQFSTPARVQAGNAIARQLGLFDIVSSLCRRLFLLQYFHQPEAAPLEKDAFLNAAKCGVTVASDLAWVDHSRHSTRQNREVPIGGIMGRVTFRANIGVLGPLLRAGEYIHIGKDTSMGLGRFHVTEEEQP